MIRISKHELFRNIDKENLQLDNKKQDGKSPCSALILYIRDSKTLKEIRMLKKVLASIALAIFVLMLADLSILQGQQFAYLGIVYNKTHGNTDGAYVIEVLEGSPANEAGILVHDVVVEVDSEAVTSDTLAQIILQESPETTIQLTVERRGKVINLPVVLSERPESPEFFLAATQPSSTPIRKLGFLIENFYEGVIVTGLYDDHPNINDKLQLGDRIVKVGGREIFIAEDVVKAVWLTRPGTKLSLEVVRNEQSVELTDVEVVSPSLLGDPGNLSVTSYVNGMLSYENNDWFVGGGVSYPSGIRAEDIITAFNGAALTPETINEFMLELSPEETVTLTLERHNQTVEIETSSVNLTNGGAFYLLSNKVLFLPFQAAKAV